MHAGDPARAALEEIHNAGERASGLVRQLLAFSRKQVLERERIDLNAVILNMEKMLPRLLGEDVEVVLRLGPGLETVMADLHQVEQVLMNLTANSRDAMPRGALSRSKLKTPTWGARVLDVLPRPVRAPTSK